MPSLQDSLYRSNGSCLLHAPDRAVQMRMVASNEFLTVLLTVLSDWTLAKVSIHAGLRGEYESDNRTTGQSQDAPSPHAHRASRAFPCRRFQGQPWPPLRADATRPRPTARCAAWSRNRHTAHLPSPPLALASLSTRKCGLLESRLLPPHPSVSGRTPLRVVNVNRARVHGQFRSPPPCGLLAFQAGAPRRFWIGATWPVQGHAHGTAGRYAVPTVPGGFVAR
jgi:hypothetical protein